MARSGDSLEASSNAFMRAFVRSDHFRVAAAMCIMLEDDLMPSSHRLARVPRPRTRHRDLKVGSAAAAAAAATSMLVRRVGGLPAAIA